MPPIPQTYPYEESDPDDLLSGRWYLKTIVKYSFDLYPTIEHHSDNTWEFYPQDKIVRIGKSYYPFSGICYYLRKTTLFLYYVMYDEQGILCSHRLEAYHIDTLTSERMRLRRQLSSEDEPGAPEKIVLLFTRRKPKYDEPPQWKWIRLHRRTRRVIPMLTCASDLSNEIGRSLYEQWGPMQTDPLQEEP